MLSHGMRYLAICEIALVVNQCMLQEELPALQLVRQDNGESAVTAGR